MKLVSKVAAVYLVFVAIALGFSHCARADLAPEDYALLYADAFAHYKQKHPEAQLPPTAPVIEMIDGWAHQTGMAATTAPRGAPGFETVDIKVDSLVNANSDNPMARSIVYHEMIHFFQQYTGGITWALRIEQGKKGVAGLIAPWNCESRRAREREAYEMQAQRLDDAQMFDYARQVRTAGLDQDTKMMRSNCQ